MPKKEGRRKHWQYSLSLHHNTLQDGKLLVEFYTCYPGDAFYNAVNQCYWLEYHPKFAVDRLHRQSTVHLILPSSNSEDNVTAEGLVPFCLTNNADI